MTTSVAQPIIAHLIREDEQEELCFILWRPSTGFSRMTALIVDAVLPLPDERDVHGNAAFHPKYVMRAAQLAGTNGLGLALAHTHPHGHGWQRLTDTDHTAERRIANIAREVTGLPLLGLTFAGDGTWSARFWTGAGLHTDAEECESVRIIGSSMNVSFNDDIVPPPVANRSQMRTIHTWGDITQALFARLHIAVVGAGSVGMPIIDVLARTGVQHIGVFDFDTVELPNLDRLRGAHRLDAALRRSKGFVARRVLIDASTALSTDHAVYELSVCEPEGFDRLLDYDLIISCVDRPWPRHVLNTVAFADFIPVIDGGLIAFQNPDGALRNAYWRSAVVRPGRPCLACLGQYGPAMVQVERDGSLDDPSYIANLPADSPLKSRQNVAALSASVASAILQQLVSFVAMPSGFGDPGPLRFNVREHVGMAETLTCNEDCSQIATAGWGDARYDPVGRHAAAERKRADRFSPSVAVAIARRLDAWLEGMRAGLLHAMDAYQARNRTKE